MASKGSKRKGFSREQDVQDWLESIVATDMLSEVIDGADGIESALRWTESDEFWPTFPIDYLTRVGNLRAAQRVLGSLHSLELVSKSNRSISQEKRESLFVDLLYCTRATSQFVLFEIKNQKATTREAVSELMAYEHEALNHTPFSSANDIMMVVVSRDFPPLLEHAVTGLNTWSRRRVLCLRFDDSGDNPRLAVHIPKAWSAIGQKGLPSSGMVTAAISFEPRKDLDEGEVHDICSTAVALMVREAERTGGSGFAMVVHNLLYPGMAQGPFLLLVGAVNPFCFLRVAEEGGFVDRANSPIADYVLSDERKHDLAMSWDWLSCDGGAATEYLKGYGRATWESFSTWREIRDVRRWRAPSITMDRHLTPVSVDFWGVLGDFARDLVRHVDRMRNFMPGFARPGMDWRHPKFGVAILDEIALESPIDGGQWTFSAIFALGIRMGRLNAFGAQFAEADDDQRRKLLAAVFWAEADVFGMLHEISLRYISAKEIVEPPPSLSVGRYESGSEVSASFSAFAQWFVDHFIGTDEAFLVEAFITGLRIYAVFDPQFDVFGENADVAASREEATGRARHWLKWSVVSALGDGRDARAAALAIKASFGDRIPLAKGKDEAFEAIDGFGSDLLIDKLFLEIPRIMDSWHPQLAHTLAPMALVDHDWDWYQEQILAARARGEKNPCIFLGAGGQLGIGRIPDEHLAPHVEDWQTHVLFVDNEAGFEITLVVSWASLRAGNAPGMRLRDGSPAFVGDSDE
ncbi:hypothetical protein [Stappia sp. 28M-7]|uniref:hypothetical protein n=1 Tax=Stappia sp. 28M-7 TaxID=2762596 RepID=UPI00163B7520|nr:hypothetical protein [Stappia sp. 28M-7]MBC2857985.1 hypothetical protein [Stappia sp. 28M-7]